MTRDAPLRQVGHVELPPHEGKGGFDHAAVHAATGHVYVAHTANHSVDVFDPAAGVLLYSVPGLTGAAGVVVSDAAQLVIVTNRGENTIGVVRPGSRSDVQKLPVGMYPNGVAYDHERRNVLVANVGDVAVPGSHTLSIVSLDARRMPAEIPVPGRTRWALYDAVADCFYVNIVEPAQIVVIDGGNPRAIARSYPVPAAGPHGLDLDPVTQRLFCACDAGRLCVLDARDGRLLDEHQLSGVPDVVFFNPLRNQLYVAVGDPGTIDVFDTAAMRPLGQVATERGAHTFALAPTGDRLYAFLPASHRAAIYEVDAT